MRIVNVRAHESIYFPHAKNASLREVEHDLETHTFNSAPRNIGRELLRRGTASSFTEWRFWGFPTSTYRLHDIPVCLFENDNGGDMRALDKWLRTEGEPDVIWAEGLSYPHLLHLLFQRCPGSIKLIYPKYSEPWLIEGLEHYDTCLVDEEWQIDEMNRRHPGVACHVWDKLVDYEHHFFPTHSAKEYDICYVARLHPRKYHKLLFDALAKISALDLTTVLIGSDENDCQKYLEPMATDAGVTATFTGHLSTEGVNEFINASRLGVLCDKYDAVPRAMLEYMAADIPVLATSEMRAGSRYIGPQAGMTCPPERFHEGIIDMLDHLDEFSPRNYLIEHYSPSQVADRFWDIIEELLAKRHRQTN